MELRCRDRRLSLDRTVVMGVLNVTPDSFSDGGLWLDPVAAVRHGHEMMESGAAIIDVGGESTRPGAIDVTREEELSRVIPVIKVLAESGALISIDTRKPAVAQAAVEAGASIINDTTGESTDYKMDEVVAEAGTAVITMHSRGTPTTMRSLVDYEDVVQDVRAWLRHRAEKLEEAGVRRESIVVDPGIGFAKSAEQSLVLLRRIESIVDIGYPVLIGTSRKSFIGSVLDLPEGDRLEGTAATIAWSVAHGVQIVRVHDVRAMSRVAEMTAAIASGA